MEEQKEITPEVEETPIGETPAVVETLEDLRTQLEAEKAERGRVENLYKDYQRKESKLADRERKLDVLDTIPNLQQEIADIKEYNETMAAYLEQQFGVSAEPTPTARSPFAELRQRQAERRKEPAKKVEPSPDTEEMAASVKAQAIMEVMGWDMDSPAVKKTLHLSSAKEALEILQKEAKAQKETESKKAKEEYQQKLKEAGVTTPETGTPSGSARNFKQIEQLYVEGKVSTAEYEEAMKKYGKR